MFEPSMTVDQALALHPSAKWVFASYHLGGCSGCDMRTAETLEDLADGYGLELEHLLRDLNSLFKP